MKWFLYVWMARSAALTRWFVGSTNCHLQFSFLGKVVMGLVHWLSVTLPFIFQLVEHRFKCFDDGLIFQIVDWLRKNVVGVIVVRDKKVLHAIKGADRQCACLVG